MSATAITAVIAAIVQGGAVSATKAERIVDLNAVYIVGSVSFLECDLLQLYFRNRK